MVAVTTAEGLRERFNAGERFKFLHFWGHTPPRDGTVSRSCFSQWFDAPFAVEGVCFPTAEHFMMAKKAQLFGDESVDQRVLVAANPGAAKALGRKVTGFSEDLWLEHRSRIVFQANLAKFSQHEALREYLLQTDERVLVEASPVDRIWGIGLAASDPRADDPNHWQGLNLLGFALMSVRDALRGEPVQR